jgi:periplasmic copper chaperone A
MMLPRTLLLATGLSLVSLAALADPLTIEDAQVRAVPPGSETSAAFMTLHNTGDKDIALVDASSPAAEVMELHNHEDVDGVMQMRKVSRIIVPAGETVALAPGGLHMMLIGLISPLVEGEPVEIELRFESGTSQRFEAPVQRIVLDSGGQHGHEPELEHGHKQEHAH